MPSRQRGLPCQHFVPASPFTKGCVIHKCWAHLKLWKVVRKTKTRQNTAASSLQSTSKWRNYQIQITLLHFEQLNIVRHSFSETETFKIQTKVNQSTNIVSSIMYSIIRGSGRYILKSWGRGNGEGYFSIFYFISLCIL